MTGTIKAKPTVLGFGFITGHDGLDYVFHRKSLASDLSFESLRQGDRVVFDVAGRVNSPCAARVTRAIVHGPAQAAID